MFQLSYFYPSESLSPSLGSHTGVTLYLSQVETTAQHHMPSRAALTQDPCTISLSLSTRLGPLFCGQALFLRVPRTLHVRVLRGELLFFYQEESNMWEGFWLLDVASELLPRVRETEGPAPSTPPTSPKPNKKVAEKPHFLRVGSKDRIKQQS